jgi:hypothetical protein
MDSTPPTRPDHLAGLPDYDPVASGSGARYRAIVPAPRRAEPPQRQVGSVGRLVTAQRDAATREALLSVGRALIRADRAQVASVCNALLAGASVAEVMAALDDLAAGP